MSNQHYCLSGLISLQPSSCWNRECTGPACEGGTEAGGAEQQKTAARQNRHRNMHLIYSWMQDFPLATIVWGKAETFKGYHMVCFSTHTAVCLAHKFQNKWYDKKKGISRRIAESAKKKKAYHEFRSAFRSSSSLCSACACEQHLRKTE